ncbi:MAG: ATP-dependent RecD-like DNA helicase [Clostridia bacterium]|nr:ATP-dependent RecD-like DNA helicase [Clostridia bacterium]
MSTLRCVVEHVTYHNDENGYSVIKTRVKGHQDLVPVVGNFAEIHVGAVLTCEGEWHITEKYGQQFAVQSYQETLPATVYGIEKYLGSGLIKGIGPKYAKKIVNFFGDKTLEVIESEPQRLREIPGIGKSRVDRIIQGWSEQKEIKNIMLFLQSHDVSTSHASKIYKTYHEDSLKVVQENPYRLADDIWGIGFKTADSIAMKLGMARDSFERIRSGLVYSLNQLADQGHCYATRQQLMDETKKLLPEAEEGLLSITLDHLMKEQMLISDARRSAAPEESGALPAEDAIYLPPFYWAEVGCARRLMRILRAPMTKQLPEISAFLQREQQRTGITYDEIQVQAIQTAARSKVMVLTGGPGTGKTTTTNSIIQLFAQASLRVHLCAPTGRAAKRMTEACAGTGLESKTIHRLLSYQPPEGYQVNEKNPLQGDVLIVDECSMIDVMLMYNLLKAVPDHMIVIFVGDVDQLPSIGAGNVLQDIISSGAVPVVRLERIFRQAQGSQIIMNAHRIRAGQYPDCTGRRDGDFFMLPEEDPGNALRTILDLCQRRLPKAYHLDPVRQIQVLTPMQRGEIGAVNLNQHLQEILNPQRAGSEGDLRHGGRIFRVRDKVMQIRNNYEKEVFNGDIGFVTSVSTYDREIVVDFDGKSVTYEQADLDELTLAYATTIHKAQGSEYPVVVMPVMMTHYPMLQRNLVYTGITRAKKLLVVVGQPKALSMAVGRNDTIRRNTRLAERLTLLCQ